MRTAVIHVPLMKNEACVQVVRQAVLGVPHVRGASLDVNRERREVSIEYDSLKLSLKNIEFTIANAGFSANSIPANEQAAKALPAACAE